MSRYELWVPICDIFILIDNFPQSHASAILRIGTIIFALGYVAFIALELITVVEEEPGSPCHSPLKATVCCLNIIFVALQGFLVFYYPRLNLNINPVIDRYRHSSRVTVPNMK